MKMDWINLKCVRFAGPRIIWQQQWNFTVKKEGEKSSNSARFLSLSLTMFSFVLRNFKCRATESVKRNFPLVVPHSTHIWCGAWFFVCANFRFRKIRRRWVLWTVQMHLKFVCAHVHSSFSIRQSQSWCVILFSTSVESILSSRKQT